MSKLNTVMLYHIATNVDDFRSFFREGAKSITPESDKGFHVWTNEELADTHFRLLNEHFLNKTLKNCEAIMIGVCRDKKEITYPLWQMDVEFAPGLYDLLAQYTPTIKNKKFDINLPPNNSFLKKITGFSCQKANQIIQFTFEGKTSIDTDMSLCVIHHTNQPCQSNEDILFLQSLTDTLCHHNKDFQKSYNELMQSSCSQKAALKYTGLKPLEISLAQYMKFDAKGNLNKTSIFDKTKGSQQMCPFLKIKNLQR